jgi:hypothetical protein
MQNAAGDGVARAPRDRDDAYRAVVSDLVSLTAHVQNSLRLIEQTIAGEASPGSPESSINVIVLDDVSPRCMKAAAAVQTCDVNLGIALHALLDSGDSDPSAASLPALSRHRRVRSTLDVRCPSAANFSSDFLAPLTTCCNRGLASGMPQLHRRTRMPPRRWRSLTRRSTI